MEDDQRPNTLVHEGEFSLQSANAIIVNIFMTQKKNNIVTMTTNNNQQTT